MGDRDVSLPDGFCNSDFAGSRWESKKDAELMEFFSKKKRGGGFNYLLNFHPDKKGEDRFPFWRMFFFRWVGSTNTPSSGVLGNHRSRQGIEWPEPEKDSGWFSITWMSQNTEVDGSMVNGSVGHL